MKFFFLISCLKSSTQLKSLLGVIASVGAEPSIREQTGSEVAREEDPPITRSSLPPEPSSTAILTSLFGWSLAPSTPHSLLSTTASPSWSRASSRASSVSPQGTPAAPPTASFNPQTPRRSSGINGASQNKTSSFRPMPFDTVIPWSPRGSVAPERRRDTSLLHCSLCLRRLGLWAVGSAPRASRPTNGENAGSALPQNARQIDLLREHRPYCPYVVRSTTVPSLPVTPTNATHTRVPSVTSSLSLSSNSHTQVDARQSSVLEGWRAVLMVVLRYRMGQWQHRKASRSVTECADGEPNTTPEQENIVVPVGPPETGEEPWVEVDPVEAMIEGVKSRGVRFFFSARLCLGPDDVALQGSELMKYVRGLLG